MLQFPRVGYTLTTSVRSAFVCPTAHHSLRRVMAPKPISPFPGDCAAVMPFDAPRRVQFTSTRRVPTMVNVFFNCLWCQLW